MFRTLARKLTGYSFEHEYRFHPTRKWRFDYANFDLKVAIEIEGGVWSNGRHTRGKGYIGDMEKYNNAQLLGWVVLRYTHEQLQQQATYKQIKDMCEIRNEQLK